MKDEYMKILEEKLSKFNETTKREILEDYESHFSEGRAAGLSDEEIIRELGDIQEMIDEIPQEDLYKEEKAQAQVAMFSNERYNSEAYKGICIETASIDIAIENAIGDEIHVDYQGPDTEEAREHYKFYQYEKDGVFYVGVTESGVADNINMSFGSFFSKLFSGNFRQMTGSFGGKLTIQVSNNIPVLDVKTLSGDIEINRVKKEAIQVKSTSGDIELSESKTDALSISSTSGDIELRMVGANAANISSTSGDIELDEIDIVNLNLKSTSGDIEGKEMTNKSLSAKASSGDLSLCANAIHVNLQTGSGDAEAKIYGDTNDISAITGSGDVEIELMDVSAGAVSAIAGSGEIELRIGGQYITSDSHRAFAQGSGKTVINVQTGSGDSCVISK